MKPYQSLTDFEHIAIATRYSLKLLALPVSVWIGIYSIRRGIGWLSGSVTELASGLIPYVIVVTVLFVFGYVAALLWFFRLADGRILFCIDEEPGSRNPFTPGEVLSLLVVGVLFGSMLSLYMIDATAPYDSWIFPTCFAPLLILPVAKLLLNRAVYEGEMSRFIKRRNARLTAREKEAERKRREPIIVPPKPPETFESKVRRITSEHERRVQQLKRVPLDEDERAYLIELETSRFKDAIRALTDPSLGPSNITDNRNDLPT